MSRYQLLPLLALILVEGVLRAQQGKPPKAGEVGECEIADGVKMKFCWIPKGKATLGSPDSEERRFPNEDEHEYEEKTGFWFGKFTVTQEEWVAVMGENPSYFSSTGSIKEYREQVKGIDTKRFPVEGVSRDDCLAFLKKLNGKPNRGAVFGTNVVFALPHEDRWEYAYRGGLGNKRPFYWGEQLNGDKANCNGEWPYGTDKQGKRLNRPTDVGSYEKVAPHPWGLCDMAGNVWQMCDNKYDEEKGFFALRGGGFQPGAVGCRGANRDYYESTGRGGGGRGFRVCAFESK